MEIFDMKLQPYPSVRTLELTDVRRLMRAMLFPLVIPHRAFS